MIITQEDTEVIGDYFIDKGVRKAFDLIAEEASAFYCNTDTLKVYLSETINLLKNYEKFIEDVEKKEQKKNAREKFLEKTSSQGINL